uniref:Uncharacterized protein n=1 Tax=Kalmanozyma brasiliensis (strain GHG001) TaxID=1365824 RepID=V5EHJ2_KALBG
MLDAQPSAHPPRAESQHDADPHSAASATHNIEHPDEIIVLSDSSMDDPPQRLTPPLTPPAVTIHSDQPHLMQREISGAGSDVLNITDARIAQMQAAESSAYATDSDSDAQRGRYPRRARNVTDYNPLRNITVNTEDRASLFQLKASTRRWLGVGQDSDDEVGTKTPTLPNTSTPLTMKLGSLIAWHTHKDPLTPAVLRDLLASDDGSNPIGRAKDATSLETDSRRLKLGRAYKRPLPSTLRAFEDMEHQEWVRLEEFLPEVHRLIDEGKARAQGKIIIPMEDDDWVETVYDSQGNADVRTLRCMMGGTVTLYRSAGEESAAEVTGGEEESQGFEIVRMVSPSKSASSRLASVPLPVRQEGAPEEEPNVERDDDGVDEEQDVEVAGREMSSSPTPEPVLLFKAPAAPVQAVQAQPAAAQRLPQHAELTSAAKPVAASSTKTATSSTSHTASAKPTASSSRAKAAKAALKGTSKRDLLSYFSKQAAPSQAASKPPIQSAPAPSTSTAKPTTSSKAKGKQRALDEDIQAWDGLSRSQECEVEVVVDLTRSSTPSETIGRGKHPRSPSPPTIPLTKKSKHKVGPATASGGKAKKSVTGLEDPFLQAEARRQMQRQNAARAEEVSLDEEEHGGLAVEVLLPREGASGKRKHVDDGPSRQPAKKTAAGEVFVQLRPPPSIAGFKPPKKPTSSSTDPPQARTSKSSTKHSSKPSMSSKKPSSSSANANASGSGSSFNPRLPQATPSPTRGGWKGITGWYSARDAFSPTPAVPPKKGGKK